MRTQLEVPSKGRTEFGVRDLDEAISGGIPTRSMILLNGGPGTGKTILGMTFLWNGLEAGENGVYVSFGEGKAQTFANMKKLGMDFKKFEDERKFTFLEMLAVTGPNMGDEVARISKTISEHKAKRAVIDSFSAISQAFGSKYEGRQVLQTVVQKLIRTLGCTTIIISERPYKTSKGFIAEGFLADGIISLTDGIPRKLEIHKMRGTRILHRELLFTIEGKLDVTRTVLVVPDPRKRWAPVILDGHRISTGHEEVDAALGGGFLPGTYVVIEADTNVTFDEIRLFTHGAICNFLSQGMGVLYLPPGGADVREVVDELHHYLRTDELEILRVAEELTTDEPTTQVTRMSPYIVLLKGGRNNIDADSYMLINTLADLKRRTGDKPVLRVMGYDTMESKYSEVIPKLYNEIGSAVLRTRAAGDVTIAVARPNLEILPKVLDMVDWHFKLTKVHDTLLFQSIKPQTVIHAVRCDASRGYQKVALTPLR